MAEFNDFKNFEKDGWEERASTYGNWAVTSQIVPVAVEALNLSSDDYVLELASGPGYGTSEISKKRKPFWVQTLLNRWCRKQKNFFPP